MTLIKRVVCTIIILRKSFMGAGLQKPALFFKLSEQ